MLNSLDILNINIFFKGWWTLFIIVPSLISLFTDDDKVGSIIFLVIGLLLFMSIQNIINFELIRKITVPLIIVIIGLSLIFKDALNNKVNKEINKLNKNINKDNNYFSFFSAQKIDLDEEEFKGSEITSIFGATTLNLTKAKIEEDIVINATSIFGGIDIYVPTDVNIKIKSTSIFGGVDDKRINKDNNNKITIYVNTTSIFGGVVIKWIPAKK